MSHYTHCIASCSGFLLLNLQFSPPSIRTNGTAIFYSPSLVKTHLDGLMYLKHPEPIGSTQLTAASFFMWEYNNEALFNASFVFLCLIILVIKKCLWLRIVPIHLITPCSTHLRMSTGIQGWSCRLNVNLYCLCPRSSLPGLCLYSSWFTEMWDPGRARVGPLYLWCMCLQCHLKLDSSELSCCGYKEEEEATVSRDLICVFGSLNQLTSSSLLKMCSIQTTISILTAVWFLLLNPLNSLISKISSSSVQSPLLFPELCTGSLLPKYLSDGWNFLFSEEKKKAPSKMVRSISALTHRNMTSSSITSKYFSPHALLPFRSLF